MNSRKLKPLFLVILISLHLPAISQEKKDTVYFDEDWSICEKPVAAYYRACTLNKENQIFYKGKVEDYFIDGRIEMSGDYSTTGFKNGEFIFYNHNGILVKKGNYIDDEMSGDWYYYDSIGNLKAEFNCKSETDFTPILLINNNNDTLLRNGNGKFTINIQDDLPHIFPSAEAYIIKGNVENNLKNGIFEYYTYFFSKQQLSCAETYKNGKFTKAKQISLGFGTQIVNHPLSILNLTDENLAKVDRFYHSNSAFGFGTLGDQRVINFLLTGNPPEIESSAKSFYDNDNVIFDIIGNVLRNSLKKSSNTHITYSFPSRNPFDVYYSFNSPDSARNIKGDIVLTTDTSGNIIHSVFDANLTQSEINKINYYLSHVSNLVPYEVDGIKLLANMNLELNTLITPVNGDTVSCTYEIYNADSVNKNDLANYIFKDNNNAIQAGANTSEEDYDKVFTSVQVEAQFPGGQDAWRKYLERNLNNQTPADHGARPGNYTVIVSFMVDEKGNVSDVRAENNPGYGTAEEAVRVIKNGPAWKPAIQNGRIVKYIQKQNITFQVVSR